jgi:LysR family transcriptional regulator, regulator for metE and metH
MIEIRHFQLIQAIAQTGSVTKASQKLCLTQPSLSHQLKEIESRLGTRLFLRVNKSMVITPEGKKILDAGHEILTRVSVLEQDIKANTGSSRLLRITTQCYTCYHWLPLIMKKFQTQMPHTEIDIVTEAMSNPVDYLLRGQIDLAVANSMKETNGIRFEKLFDDEQVVLVPSKHLLAKRKFIQPSDFAGEHLIVYKQDSGTDHFTQTVLAPQGIQVGKITRMQLTEARVELVKAGIGLTVMSRWLVRPFARDSKAIKLLPIGKNGFYRTWYIATLDQKRNDPVVKEFTGFLKEQQLGVS